MIITRLTLVVLSGISRYKFLFSCFFVFVVFISSSFVVASATETNESNTTSFVIQKKHQTLLLNEQELSQVLSHGPWPPKTKSDSSNRVSSNDDAIKFGKALFFSTRLSSNNTMSCVSCHAAESAFASGKFVKDNPKAQDRNTQSLFNVRYNRWFGWDGSKDNLWAQSIRPIINPKEMNLPIENIKSVIQDSNFKAPYKSLFGNISTHSDELVLVNIGKSLSAFQETLVTKKTTFDHFRDAVQNENWDKAAKYPESAQRGLSLFMGRGNCSFCHSGPLFTNGEFLDAGVPYFIRPGVVDKGRHQGIINLKKSLFTLASDYNDDPSKADAWAVNNVARKHSDFGIFRVPGLRGIAKTAPYMHNGSLETLEAVVDHYANINIERLHADGESLLKPLNITDQESKDLVNFLRSLSD